MQNPTTPKRGRRKAPPNLKTHYSAAQIKPLINICTPTFQARWKDIELSIMDDPPIHAVLTHKILVGLINEADNPLLSAQLKKYGILLGMSIN